MADLEDTICLSSDEKHGEETQGQGITASGSITEDESLGDPAEPARLSGWRLYGTAVTFLIIWSKLSDSLGRRQCLSAAIIIFTVASGACGGAQTIDQLIIFRAFQGVGGSGLLSLNFVIVPEMVQPKKYALYAAVTSCSIVLGFLFGPLSGGAIVDSSTWRWVFLLNVPGGILALIMLFIFMPVGFPDINATAVRLQPARLEEIDVVGAFLIFGTCALLVSALEEAGWQYSWSSPTIIVLLILAAIFAVGVPFWEALMERNDSPVQAIFPWYLMKHRILMADLLITFFAGTVFTTSVILIPQEWQTVFHTSALIAGVRLLPYTVAYSIGSVLAMILASKLKIPPVFIVLMGAALQTVATSVMGAIPVRTGAGKYVAEVILGIGVGENIGIMVQMTPQLIRGKYQAVAMGAVTQSRALGGVVGFAITTNVFNVYLKSELSGLIDNSKLARLLASFQETLATLMPSERQVVVDTFSNGYALETKILIGFSVAQIAAVILMWEKKLRTLI